MREEFLDRAINPLTKAYLETYRYLKQEKAFESGGIVESNDSESKEPEDNNVFGGASIGDFIQWESQGALQFQTPQKVRWISDDGTHLAVEGSDTGIPMEQVTVQSAHAAAPPPQLPPRETNAPEMQISQRGFQNGFVQKLGQKN